MKAGIFSLIAFLCLVGMYLAYEYLKSDPNLFSLSIGMLGAGFGFFASKASSVKNERQIERILGAALIKEKEIEAQTVDDAKQLYEKELENLQEIIEREGNVLLLKRMKEVYLEEIREKLREVDSIEGSLNEAGGIPSTPEVESIRTKLEGLLQGVRNPEEDDRLIKQFCYSLPIMGNMIYFIYSIWKKVDPTLQDKVHSRINSFAQDGNGSRPIMKVIAFSIIAIFVIGLLSVAMLVISRLFSG